MKYQPEHILKNAGLRITPLRIAILDAIKKLDILVENDIITRVKTEKDLMRYEFVEYKHHHLYCSNSGKTENYTDKKLDQLIENYFKNKKINNFLIEEIRLQINGKFIK